MEIRVRGSWIKKYVKPILDALYDATEAAETDGEILMCYSIAEIFADSYEYLHDKEGEEKWLILKLIKNKLDEIRFVWSIYK